MVMFAMAPWRPGPGHPRGPAADRALPAEREAPGGEATAPGAGRVLGSAAGEAVSQDDKFTGKP